MPDKFTDHTEEGVYTCKKCSHHVFDSGAKFKAEGVDAPSFRTVVPGGVAMGVEITGGQVRTKFICSSCGMFLGHVFNDGKEKGDTHPEAGRRFTTVPDVLEFKSAAEIIENIKKGS